MPSIRVPVGYRVGQWTVKEPVGAGSWGSVYAVERTADGSPAAIKFLRTDLLTPGQRTSMEALVTDEVRFALEADHPHLVRTHTVLTVRDELRPELDGLTALVMDRAEQSLQDLLAGGAGWPAPRARQVLRDVAAGLAHLHARGRIHGDLKPANVLLGPRGAVWLADFGLTAELEGTHAYVLPLGSLDHVPPEWWTERTGFRGTKLRPTADVWAFGVLAHQVLTGGLHPFPGATARARALAAQTYARGGARLRLDETVPEEWRRLIAECLRPDHVSRSRLTAGELAARTARLCHVPDRAPRRRPTVLLAVCATLLTAAAGTGVVLATGAGAGPEDAAAAGGVPVRPATPTGALPARSDIPPALRPHIVNAAMRCPEREVTPVLIAAMLKAESRFDPDAVRVRTSNGIRMREYGIAMWTPEVFRAWSLDGDGDGRKDYMSAPDAIAAMGPFLCYLDQQFKENGLTQDLPALIAAGYRTSARVITEERGVPARTRPYVAEVQEYLAEYSR
ncbi:serine/threonine protein kinase [Streptomyces sp. NPDC059176]|uniref:serine/threonine protein kinase n=1 Tax=Streptomyces sp. NPDC059176 TaxID=3346758 RepID=UPI003683C4D6